MLTPARRRVYVPFFVTILLCSLFFESYPQSTRSSSRYDRSNAMITVRDGTRLNTVIFRPRQHREPLPFLLLRTPYGVDRTTPPDLSTYLKDMAADDYIFVFQDIRGRYQSEGTFEMQRFSRDRSDPKSIDESTDTYDTIDWLVKNAPDNNGRVGVLGISYGGWLTVMATLEPHPALKAASEQATPADMYLGDDFHHNGAFRLSYGFEYAFMEEASKVDTLFPFDTYDTFEWYLKLGSLSNANAKHFHGTLPTWNDFVSHPNYDEFWQKQSLPSRLDAPTVPIMHVAGWWDQEDFYGPVKTYEVLEKKDLPIKFLAFSPCFRREAGSHGKDTKGLIRVHEFYKVEQVVLCEANHQESVEHHEQLTKNSEELLQALGIPYHVVVNCGADIGLGQVKKYDIEAWVPTENTYRETHSSSYFHDFQTRRLNIRYRNDE